MSTQEAPQWATIAEVADQLGVHRDTIRRMIRRGDLEAKRFGPRLIRVDTSSIDGPDLKVAA